MTADSDDKIHPDDKNNQTSAGQAPMPRIKKMRWPFPIIWIVPVAAACLAGHYIHQQHQETGTVITILFDDGGGLKPGETVVAYRGVTIGHVKMVALTGDRQHAAATVQLTTSSDSLAHADTMFWLVRPELSLNNISGLNTLVSGAYIDCRPGDGPICHTFNGMNGPPAIVGSGLNIIASADQITALTVDSPVNYRGIQVGIVKDIRLSSSAEAANVTLFIWDRYKSLVRTNSRFWMINAADIQGSLLGGLKLKLGSVQNILTGGVAFATPERDFGLPATDGSSFVLHDHADDDWLKWKAKIRLPANEVNPSEQKTAADLDNKQMPGMKRD